MTRRSAKVVLVHEEAYTMASDWDDHLELRRDRYAGFCVFASKYGDDPDRGGRRWFDYGKSKGLKTPTQVMAAIVDNAESISVEIDWVAVVPLVATIDWLTAAVIAEKLGQPIPVLPKPAGLLPQRSFRSFQVLPPPCKVQYSHPTESRARRCSHHADTTP